jgi:hypothetical protein
MTTYYDRTGVPMSRMQWMQTWPDQLRVLRTLVIDTIDPDHQVTVSTVWLGIDHNHGDDIEPVIFETMTFSSHPDDRYDDHELCDRYPSETTARVGHRMMVARVAAGMTNPAVLDAPTAPVCPRDHGVLTKILWTPARTIWACSRCTYATHTDH